MARFLLDTTFLIDVLNERRGRADMMERFIREQHTLACCSINVSEVYAGLRPSESLKTEKLLRRLLYVPIRWETAKLAGDLKREWGRQGQTVAITDLTIAAVCLTENLTLVTDNRKHFPMPELSLYPV